MVVKIHPALLALLILFSLMSLRWMISANDTPDVTYVATVTPQRVILVDKNFIIQRILSNTKEDVRPVVFLEDVSGQELPYSESIRKQYEFLQSSLHFGRAGVLYERKNAPPAALADRVRRTFFKFLNL